MTASVQVLIIESELVARIESGGMATHFRDSLLELNGQGSYDPDIDDDDDLTLGYSWEC